MNTPDPCSPVRDHSATRELADRSRFDLSREAATAWDALNGRPTRELPGLRRLVERPTPFVE